MTGKVTDDPKERRTSVKNQSSMGEGAGGTEISKSLEYSNENMLPIPGFKSVQILALPVTSVRPSANFLASLILSEVELLKTKQNKK